MHFITVATMQFVKYSNGQCGRMLPVVPCVFGNGGYNKPTAICERCFRRMILLQEARRYAG